MNSVACLAKPGACLAIKVRGVIQQDFVGYWLDVVTFEVGLSERRAQWIADWSRKTAASAIVRMEDVREALGRMGFAAGPLAWMRPFLGPFYAWIAACPAGIFLVLPAMLRLILSWMARMVEGRRVCSCRCLLPLERGELFRVDAKAEGQTVRIGGWSLLHGQDTRAASWFSMQISETDCPWAFAKDPFQLIASLELLATLIGLMLLVPKDVEARSVHGTAGIGCGTDNRGNSLAVEKWMTTKYPLCNVLMELSEQLYSRNLVLRLSWLPREGNQPADDLTNEIWSRFDPARRVCATWKDLKFVILPQLMADGVAFLSDVQERRKMNAAVRQRGSGPQREPLRSRDPW